MKTALFPTLDVYIQEALVFRNLSPRTTKVWSSSFRQFSETTGVQFLEDITEDALRHFLLHGRTKLNWSPYTHDHHHRGLNPFLKWCVRKGYIPENPLDHIERPRLPKSLPKRISELEAFTLLETCLNLRYTYRFERYRNHALISLLLFTGLRLQESLNLGVGDVDLHENVISVRSGKGNKDRLVPISIKLRAALERYIQERHRLKRECPRFFTSVRGDIPFTVSGVRDVIKRLRKATNIEFSAHRLRHTFATMMLEQGCDLYSLSKMLGHSDIKTTTIYLSASVSHLQQQIHKHPLNSPFRGR